MTDPLAPIGDGHTEVPDDLREHLIPTYIATLTELYEAEAENIATGTYGRQPNMDELLDDGYLRELHRVMFHAVWRWAGRYRQTDVNIGGVDWHEVPVRVRLLVDDTKYWVGAATFDHDEIAIRFHHRLVQIHPFPNGNGRLGRFAADYVVQSLGRPRFTWGISLGIGPSALRDRYRKALQRLDSGPDDIEDLLAFARS